MDAASAVHVDAAVGPRDRRLMGVAGDQNAFFLAAVANKAVFNGPDLGVVLCRAGGILDASQLQRPPEVADQPSRQFPELVVDRISLIAVEAADRRQIQAVDDHRFIEGDRRRQPAPDVGAIFFDPVVVAEEEEEPVVLVILFQELIDLLMGFVDVGKAAVFPEFVPVSQLYVGEALLIVVLQGRGEDGSVGEEIIAPGAGSPVTVAHEDDLRMILCGNVQSAAERFLDPFGFIRHKNTSGQYMARGMNLLQ